VINSNLDSNHRFRDTATYSFKHSIQKRGQTTAGGHMVTIDSLYGVATALSDSTIADSPPLRLTV